MRRGARGYSLIEQAAVLPILLLFLFGTIDASRFFHVYSALESGVTAALRCVYPVDGRCVSVTPDSREPLYRVTISDATSAYYTTTYDYSGEASWLQFPAYTLSNFNARILDSVSVSMSDSLVRAIKPYYEVFADYGYWVRAAQFPYFSGDALSGAASYRNGGGSMPPRRQISLSGVSLSSTGTTNDAVDFKVASPIDYYNSNRTASQPLAPADSELICFESLDLEEAASRAHLPNFSRSCGASGPVTARTAQAADELKTKGHLAFHVTGRAWADPGTTGAVELEFVSPVGADFDRTRDVQSRLDLGGRLISEGSSGDFVPRGVPTGWVDSNTKLSKTTGEPYTEFEDYQTIEIPYGKLVRLKFTLKRVSGTGRFGWSGETLRIWVPEYRYVTGTTSCSEPLPELEKTQIAKCDPADKSWVNQSVLKSVWSSGKIVRSSAINVGCAALLNLDAQDALTQAQKTLALKKLVPDPGNFTRVEQISSSLCPGFNRAKLSCSASNRGIAAGSAPGSKELLDACGARVQYLGQPVDPKKLAVTPKLQTITQSLSPPFSWRPSRCDALAIPKATLDQLKQGYQDAWFVPPERSANGTIILTDPVSPVEFQASHPEVQCAEVAVSALKYDDRIAKNPLPPESLFVGEEQEICGDWQAALRTEALRNGMHRNSYFVADRKPLNETLSAGVPVGGCYRVAYIPSNSAAEDLGVFTQSEIPSSCSEKGRHCAFSYAGLTGGDTGATTIDLEAAASEAGFSAVKAAMPSAQLGCTGNDCVKIEVEDDAGTMRAAAQAEIHPLLLLGKPIAVSYSSYRQREDSFAR